MLKWLLGLFAGIYLMSAVHYGIELWNHTYPGPVVERGGYRLDCIKGPRTKDCGQYCRILPVE